MFPGAAMRPDGAAGTDPFGPVGKPIVTGFDAADSLPVPNLLCPATLNV